MKWLRENITRKGVVTTTDAWLLAKLTGGFFTDISTASRTLLLDIHSGAWSGELLELWGLEKESLPEVVGNDQTLGAINAADLPSLRGVELSGVIVDQAAALFAQSCLTAGEAKCTYGTGAFLLANIGATPKISNFGLATSIAWDVRGARAHYLDGQVFTAASAVAWLIENGLLESAEAIDALPRESGGVMAVSALAGFGAPRWKPSGSGAIAGISLASTKAHIARAVVDGIAAQVTELIAAMSADGVALQRLRVDGGLTRSKTLMQMQADLAQIPVDVYPHPDATALGVAAIAHLGADSSLSVDDAIAPWRPVSTYEPEWSADRAAEYMSMWKGLADNAQERSAHG
jgi:glycerol kinase